MRYVMWAIKLLIFLVVLMFAYKNMQPVDVYLLGQAQISGVPLVVVLLIAFVLGTVLGLVLMLPSTWRRRREAGKLKRDLGKAQEGLAQERKKSSDASSGTSEISAL
jgi:lipopolysaccharide assembly protein A